MTNMDLPTTPIGKQQVIDLRAGAILRENSRKSNQYLGCPVGVLLILVVMLKSAIIGAWIIREYSHFDFVCNSLDQNSLIRVKRWTPFNSNSEALDPRTFAKDDNELENELRTGEEIIKKAKKRPVLGGSRRGASSSNTYELGPIGANLRVSPEAVEEDDDMTPSTVVTLTNTQLIPLKGNDHGTVKMKTIRNRVEKIGSDEEQFIEINIADAPRIYVSKIKSRNGGDDQEDEFDLLKDLITDQDDKKKKRKKGKGLKKAKKLEEEKQKSLNNTENLENAKKEKKLKGKGKKSKKNNSTGDDVTEMTKAPRHLFTGAGYNAPTTSRPHQSSWINGVVDPDDPLFSNQGSIRGYPMKTASQKPAVPSSVELKISNTTRIMWEMDELNFTTFMSPVTTETTRTVVEEVEIKKIPSRPTMGSVFADPNPQATQLAPKNEPKPPVPIFGNPESNPESVRTEIVQKETEPRKMLPVEAAKAATTTARVWLPPKNPDHHFEETDELNEQRTRYEVRFEKSAWAKAQLPINRWFAPPAGSATSKGQPGTDLPNGKSEEQVLEPVNPAFLGNRFGSATESSPFFVDDADTVKVSVKDLPVIANVPQQPPAHDPEHFEAELSRFTSSAACFSRIAFDVWCCVTLLATVPTILGVCRPVWSLFIVQIVCDVACLVVGFVISFTLALLSIIVYFMVDEMTSDALFQLLFISFSIAVALFLYSTIVVVGFRCCNRLVRNYRKDGNDNFAPQSADERQEHGARSVVDPVVTWRELGTPPKLRPPSCATIPSPHSYLILYSHKMQQPPPQPPTELPGLALQRQIPPPTAINSQQQFPGMFQPFNNGFFPPPEVAFPSPSPILMAQALLNAAAIIQQQQQQAQHQQQQQQIFNGFQQLAVPPPVQHLPPHDDRDSGTESRCASMTPSNASPALSRSPSHSSRSSSFSHQLKPYNITQLLQQRQLAQQGSPQLSRQDFPPPPSLGFPKNDPAPHLPEVAQHPPVEPMQVDVDPASRGTATPMIDVTTDAQTPQKETTSSAFVPIPQTPQTFNSYPHSIPQTPTTLQSKPPGFFTPTMGQQFQHQMMMNNAMTPQGRYNTIAPPVPMPNQSAEQFHQQIKDYYAQFTMPVNPDPSLRLGGRDVCTVCNDNASGYHYGVMSCEGCKGFFRRSVQKNMTYQCHKSSACKVDRISRNRCQACRYEKCVKAGMNKDQVRLQDKKNRRKGVDEKENELDETKKDVSRIQEVATAYREAFPDGYIVESLKAALSRVHYFITKVPEFESFDSVEMARRAEAALRGVMLLRSAFSADPCECIKPLEPRFDEVVMKLRSNVKELKLEELSLLSAIYISQANSNGEDDETFHQMSRSLRACVATHPLDQNSYEKLVFKLGLIH
ncbi:unnamed protein product [Caenorhabditis auriculariae]|uniref:Nuclear receptor domain-containing protein n=1 Tax=Caenorhabditis auriculariae TaxID=2777116 RepID=A0A8S1GZM3_9PELO|nr:unnamed protein product [Caenorhabditis auriculariae]